jgi:methionyl-tRNA formyltransferase
MKIIFAGTPEIATKPLQVLIDSGHEVIAVYTQPDRPSGRGRKLTPSAVKELALRRNIPVEQPLNFKEESSIETLKHYDADIMVVMAYGIIVPQTVLDTPKQGCINIHVSLLPRWRGAAPIQHAILSGDKISGVTIMQMDSGLDTGDILKQQSCVIKASDTSGDLHDNLAQISPGLLLRTLDDIAKNKLQPIVQNDEGKTYAHKITKADAQLHWRENAEKLERMVRGYQPFPVAYFTFNEKAIRIWQASVIKTENKKPAGEILSADKNGLVIQAGEDALCITQMQLPGKKAMAVSDILNANKDDFFIGKQL